MKNKMGKEIEDVLKRVDDCHSCLNFLPCDPEGHISLCFFDAIIKDDSIWFSASDFNGLFHADLLTKNVNYIGRFEKEPILADWLYSMIIQVSHILFFIPKRAERIAVFDMNINSFLPSIELPKEAKMTGKSEKFRFACHYGDYVYLLGTNMTICKLDLQTYSVTYCKEMTRNGRKIGEYRMFSPQSAMKGNEIYSPIYYTEYMAIINLKNDEIRLVSIGDNLKIIACYCDDDVLWLSGENTITKCDYKGNVLDQWWSSGETHDISARFQNIEKQKNQIIFYDGIRKGILMYDFDRKNWRFDKLERNLQCQRKRWEKSIVILPSSRQFYMDMDDYALTDFCTGKKWRFVFDIKLFLDRYSCDLQERNLKKYFLEKMFTNNAPNSLKSYILDILLGNAEKEGLVDNNDIGKNIYGMLK